MREIKFRAWDGEHMNDMNYLANWHLGMINPNDELPLFMQFTGLHDKNGKEIYEGDIIEQDGLLREVEWDYTLLSAIKYNKFGSTHGAITVIGNIHENPELTPTNIVVEKK